MQMAKQTPKTLADFKSAYDPNVKIPTRIREGLVSLAKEGPEAWEFEVDFIKRCGLSVTQFAAFREPFSDHIVETRPERTSNVKRVWFGDKKVAAKAKICTK